MKLIVLTAALLGLFAADALAQSSEQQVYSIYPRNQGKVAQQQDARQEAYQGGNQAGARRVYPGREAYGRDFGPLTRHPGDYRDAVDRGQWAVGGPVGSRNFSVD